MQVTELASVDGSISPTAEASIPVADDGLLRGDGVFEMVRLYGGRPFTLADHLDRLERSAAAIELPLDRAVIEREIDALLAEFGDARRGAADRAHPRRAPASCSPSRSPPIPRRSASPPSPTRRA